MSALSTLPTRYLPSFVRTNNVGVVLSTTAAVAACLGLLFLVVVSSKKENNIQNILWPKSRPDSSVDALLPPGTLGCPLFGHGIKVMKGSKKVGKGKFLYKLVQRFPNSKLIKYYAFGTPNVVVADGDTIKELANSEFEDDGVASFIPSSPILGEESILTESDKKKHSRLRRLIGQSMTPTAVSKSIPTLKIAAEKQIEILKNNAHEPQINENQGGKGEGISANDLCTAYTVDVAWNQILGLDLKEEEVPIFEKAVNDWVSGFLDIFAILGIKFGFLKHWKAMDYLKSKIGQKIDELKEKGPDSSTLSGLVFAVDDEEKGSEKAQLTRTQIIDNALIMILAGSETSASTLAISLLALKLNPTTWTKLVEEQRVMMEKHGDILTKATLDDECPYLDAVIRETLRLAPLNQGAPRKLKKTKVSGGYQIPKGWLARFSPLLTHYYDPITYEEDGSHMDLKLGFKPERWLKEETRPSSNFIPMLAGPRYCLGANLAYAEMKVFLAMMARKVDYKLLGSYEEGIEWKPMGIMPKALDGVPLVAV